jgi:hypothetical protein
MRSRRERRSHEQEQVEDSSASLEEQNSAIRLLSESLEREIYYHVSSEFNARQLTQTLRGAKRDLKCCKKDIERLERQLREETSARQAERERADLLQQQQHRDQESQTRLQQKAEELEKRLREQADVNTSLGRLMPEMRSLIEAWERRTAAASEHNGRAQASADSVTTSPNQNDQARNLLAATTVQDVCRRNVVEREVVLTCPISLELFENPVVTECCGKTFSSEALVLAGRRSSACPFCRSHQVQAHPNQHVEKLVDLHRAERQVLGIQEVQC